MNNLVIENQGNTSYLVYQIDKNNPVDSMTLGMITNNRIRGLAATSFTQVDSNEFIRYNISSKISVKQLFEGTVNKARFVGILSGIVEALLTVDEYMIDRSSLVMDLNYIYADVSSYDVAMICLPVIVSDGAVDLGQFFKNIVITTIYDQTEPFDYIAKILNFLNGSPNFSTTDFRNLLEQLQQEKSEKKVVQNQQNVNVQREVNRTAQPVVTHRPEQQEQGSGNKAINSTVIQKTNASQQNIQNNISQNIVQNGVQNTVGGNTIPNGRNGFVQNNIKNQQPAEKEITLFGLLRNYSKENAAKYKEQKQNAKAAPPVKQGKQPPAVKPQRDVPNRGFMVPGQAPATNQNVNAQGFAAQPTVQNQSAQPATAMAKKNEPMQNVIGVQSAQISTSKADFGNTTVLNAGVVTGETTVLGAASSPEPHLVRVKNGEQIRISKPVFRIGKEHSYVDYWIGDNAAVSRSHANIISRNGEYFILDTNSTNHTFVNGKMIPKNEETKLTSGAKIRLANEEFEFRMI